MTTCWHSSTDCDYSGIRAGKQRDFNRIGGHSGIKRIPELCLLFRIRNRRHTLAVRTLVNWYRRDQDPERLLPILSAWLGHVKVSDTQWYLEGAPELMREAMRRLERRWEGQT